MFVIGIVLYKSIMLSNNERTPQVIRNAMLKLGLEGNPDNYTLAQVLPEKGKHRLCDRHGIHRCMYQYIY